MDFFQGDNVPLDPNGHGTHVAGTIGARGNNSLGVTGVNWQVSIMPLRAGDASGSLSESAIISSINYACANGARVVNGSFGGSASSQAMFDAITSTACDNTLFVFAAGNGGQDGIGDDNDSHPQYPCNYNTTRIICVAATDSNDARASFSNIGPTSVDLAAPGVGILSSTPTYENLLADGFEDPGFSTRWGSRTAPAGHPLWGQQNLVYAGGGTFSLSDSPSGNYAINTDTKITSLGSADLTGRRACSLDYFLHLSTFTDDVFRIYAASSPAGPFTDVTHGGLQGSTGNKFFGFTEEMAVLRGPRRSSSVPAEQQHGRQRFRRSARRRRRDQMRRDASGGGRVPETERHVDGNPACRRRRGARSSSKPCAHVGPGEDDPPRDR